jgi:SAM-dependent methyltransferase
MNKSEQWHLTSQAAELYERYVVRYILGPWAPLLVDAAHPADGERVLDLACGTGVVARAAAQRVGSAGRVVGIDLNPAMIEVARGLPAATGAPIEWLEGSALDIRLKDAGIDVVLCQQGLQFFPDKAGALSACGTAPGCTTVPWARRSHDLSATRPLSAFALRAKLPTERNCTVSRRKQAFRP